MHDSAPIEPSYILEFIVLNEGYIFVVSFNSSVEESPGTTHSFDCIISE